MSELPEVSHEFIGANKKLGITGQRKRGGRYPKYVREKRLREVFRYHFECGHPASKISQFLKVNRTTVINDIKVIYKKLFNEFPDNEFFDLFNKHQVRLETQRARLMEMLDKTGDISQRLSIERLLLEIDTRILDMVTNDLMREIRRERSVEKRQ